MQPALEQLVSSLGPDEYSALDLESIRVLRSQASANEEAVSYLRRVVQVRLDIVTSELDNRRSGGSPSDVSDLISRLPGLLFDAHTVSGSNRPPSSLKVPDVSDDLMAMVDAVLPTSQLVALNELSEQEIVALSDETKELESEISATRRRLHGVIDSLGRELAQRFRADGSQVGSIER